MKLIVAIAVGSPLGRVLRRVAQERWWEWVARIHFSAPGKQYKFVYAHKPKAQQLIDSASLEEWMDYTAISAELTKRRIKIKPDELHLAMRIAQVVWTDALWGYGVEGWTTGTAPFYYVKDTYDLQGAVQELQFPKEYLLLEGWLEQLLSDATTSQN